MSVKSMVKAALAVGVVIVCCGGQAYAGESLSEQVWRPFERRAELSRRFNGFNRFDSLRGKLSKNNLLSAGERMSRGSCIQYVASTLWSDLRDVAVVGNYANCVLAYGLVILDVTEPLSPVELRHATNNYEG